MNNFEAHLEADEEMEVYRRGLAAANLLASQDFADTIKSLMIESYAVFTETQPDEQSKREDTYNLCRGLKALEDELRARVQAKDEIERRETEAETQADLPFLDDDSPITITGD